MNNDDKWMRFAIEEAIIAEESGEVPVGAVLVKNNLLIARAHNKSVANNDATAHAEINLLKAAGKKLQNYRLNHTTIYSTLEPCAMCYGAMVHARIERLVFGAYDKKTGVCGSCSDLTDSNFFNHRIIVTGGVLLQENQNILKSFFETLRK